MDEKLPEVKEPEMIPTLALKLYAASVRMTTDVTNHIIERQNTDLKLLREALEKQESDALAINQLHSMLMDPVVCRKLMNMIWDAPNHDSEIDDE